jgi:hypothetical protein
MGVTLVSSAGFISDANLTREAGSATMQEMFCAFSPNDLIWPGYDYQVCGETYSPISKLCTGSFYIDEEGSIELPSNAELLLSSFSSSSMEPSTIASELPTIGSSSRSGNTSITETASVVSEDATSGAEPIPPSTISESSTSTKVTSVIPTTTSSTLPGKEFNISLTTAELAGTVVSIVFGITLIVVASIIYSRRRHRLGEAASSEVPAESRSEALTSDPDAASGLIHQSETISNQFESHNTETGTGNKDTDSLSHVHEMPGAMRDPQKND